jgi:hypothetical protein
MSVWVGGGEGGGLSNNGSFGVATMDGRECPGNLPKDLASKNGLDRSRGT